VNVARHLPRQDRELLLHRDLPNQVAHTKRHLPRQHPLAILRNPHPVHLQIVLRARSQLVPFHATTLHAPVLRLQSEGFPPSPRETLSRAVPIMIADGEAESRPQSIKSLIEYCRVDVVQPDISRAGGITEACKIATMAQDGNARLVPHAFKTGILLAACLHLIATLPDTELLEFSLADSPLRRDLLQEPFNVVDGWVAVPEKPGLGIDVNPGVIAKYRVG
jgi:hypothetical protein